MPEGHWEGNGMLTDSTEARRFPNIVACVFSVAIGLLCFPIVFFCFPVGLFVWLGLLVASLVPLFAGYAGNCKG